MKILGMKTLLALTIVFQLALTFHQPLQNVASQMPEADILGSDYSSEQEILALLTKSKELKIYKKIKQDYVFLQKVRTCQGESVTFSNMDQKNHQGSSDSKLIMTIKCIDNKAIYEFDSKTNIIKEVTVKKIIQQVLDELVGNIPLRTTRMLAENMTCNTTQLNDANATVCGDGNTQNGDGCSADCTLEYCGDAITNNNGEQCDDGNDKSGDGCYNCKLECGDGIENPGEQCDDGNKVDGDGCSSTCKFESVAVALPLALGIPVVVVALLGVVIAKCILGKSAATSGAAYSQPPAENIQMEQSTKVLNR